MAPTRPVLNDLITSDEEGVEGVGLQRKLRKTHMQLQKKFDAQRGQIFAQYSAGAEQVKQQARQKIMGLSKRINDTHRAHLDQLVQIIERRDSKMIAMAKKLDALRVDILEFCTVVNAECKRIQEQGAPPQAGKANPASKGPDS